MTQIPESGFWFWIPDSDSEAMADMLEGSEPDLKTLEGMDHGLPVEYSAMHSGLFSLFPSHENILSPVYITSMYFS